MKQAGDEGYVRFPHACLVLQTCTAEFIVADTMLLNARPLASPFLTQKKWSKKRNGFRCGDLRGGVGGCHLCGITNRGLAETWPFLSVKFRINKQGTYGDVTDVLRFARILAHYPYVVLLVVFVVTATCLVVCVTIPKTLDFREPTLVSASISLSLLHSRLSVCSGLCLFAGWSVRIGCLL